jgi:tRNA1Val (adenine37-N6)-methyltransferase
MDVTERNSLFDGELICDQHIEGYRFSVDAVLLAHFATVKKNDRILDLGTGAGIISLILFYRYNSIIAECSGVEIQKSLFQLARMNMINNEFNSKNKLFNCDVKDIKQYCVAGSYDTIICNPPFYPENSGRKSINSEARLARHQISADLGDFLDAASYAVKNRGNLYFIYPAELLGEFIVKATSRRLEPKKIRFVYSYPGSPKAAQLILIQCSKNGGQGVEIEEPLYIYKEQSGTFTSEVAEYYKRNVLSINTSQSA